MSYVSSFFNYRQHCAQRKPPVFNLLAEADFEVFRPTGAYPLRDFHRICTPFQDALAVKIWLDLLAGYGVMGFYVQGSGYPIYGTELPIMCGCAVNKLGLLTHSLTGYPKIFSAP